MIIRNKKVQDSGEATIKKLSANLSVLRCSSCGWRGVDTDCKTIEVYDDYAGCGWRDWVCPQCDKDGYFEHEE